MCLIAYDDGDSATYVHIGYRRRAEKAGTKPRIGRKFDLESRL
jgi:hypothetical protein